MGGEEKCLTEDAKKMAAEGDKGKGPPYKPQVDIKDFQEHRLKMWTKLYEEAQKEERREKGPIKITCKWDGKVMDGVGGKTAPIDIAKQVKKADSIVAKIYVGDDEGTLWDMGRPLQQDCTLDLLGFETPEGNHTFWHSSAHILGESLENLYGAHLCAGPPVEGGFYYDVQAFDKKISQDDFKNIQKEVDKVVKDQQPFERLQLKKEDALEMFKYNPYKLEILTKKVPEGAVCTAYRCGPLIDLCRGPHVPNTGRVKSFEVTKNSSSYWMASADNDSLQRVYGVSFPDKKLMKEHKHFLEEAAKRDHRLIGQAQQLFFFNGLSPGSCFFMPHGTRIYNKLVNLIKGEYWKRGYEEVVTPNVYNLKLWETSGHLQNYKDNMFIFTVENEEFGMKPMNCPGHCIMFDHRVRSFRELPLRMADFGVLHRNELSGALTGLTRVRRFQQDDAHIFCMESQIEEEVNGVLDFLDHIYGIFGFDYDLELSTRPEKYLGEIEVWDRAEKALANSLDTFTKKKAKKWEINPADGAFYGPKIDITVFDALRRKFQCATIQLDFQLPLRFNLQYNSSVGDGEGSRQARPVMIHRAILGSVERMIAILTEHFAGKWPFWLSPRQCIVLPLSEKFNDYAVQCRDKIFAAGYFCDVELSSKTLQKKVRESQKEQYNYILVVGEKEMQDGSVNVRTRDNKVHGTRTVDALLAEFAEMLVNFQ